MEYGTKEKQANLKDDFIEAHKRWTGEIDLAEEHFKEWCERGRKVVDRYRDERERTETDARFNILWANVETLTPAVYSKKPKPEVSRRYNDADPAARVASMMLERALEFEIDQYDDFNHSMLCVVQDRLLPGRGVAWSRYEPNFTPMETAGDTDQVSEDMDPPMAVTAERAPTDYVFWKDFLHSPARTWEEVTWVARRVYMGKKEGKERFGDDFDKVPLNHMPASLKEHEKVPAELAHMKKAEIWEIWCKDTAKVYWVCRDHNVALDIKPDPLELEDFFPCPKPVYATITNDSLIPVPDYAQYQDQADELDQITARIASLVSAVKVAGVYDATAVGVKQLLSSGVENTLIPVDSWSMFAEKGGVKGVVDWFPLEQVVSALDTLYTARESIKQTIYEITGLADIIRGASQASETATAQRIKSDFASLRIRRLQQELARFAAALLSHKAQIMCSHFDDQTLIRMSGIEQTIDGQNPELVMAALQILRDDAARGFRIEVSSDSMVELDEAAEKSARVEFLTAVGGFMERAIPAAQAAPQLSPLLMQMLKFGVQSFKPGREIEAVFDEVLPQLSQQEQPSPQMMQKEQELAEREQMLAQAEQRAQAAQQDIEAKSQQLKELGMTTAHEKQMLDMRKKHEAEIEKLSQMFQALAEKSESEIQAVRSESVQQTTQKLDQNMQGLEQFASQVGDALTQLADAMVKIREEQAGEIRAVAEGVTQTQELLMRFASAKRTPLRGKDGRVAGVNIEGFTESVQ